MASIYWRARTTESAALALKQSFPYILVFKGAVGLHLIASTTPLRVPNADEFLKRMPLAARKDLVEWEHATSPLAAARGILSRQIPFDSLLPAPDSRVPALSDDRPYNEYNLLRRTFGKAG